MVRRLIFAVATLSAFPAHAWNGLGLKVVADIAWQQLDASTRQPHYRMTPPRPRNEQVKRVQATALAVIFRGP